MAKELKIRRVELQRWSQPDKRVARVYLNNGSYAHIGRCYESWEIYDATLEEKRLLVDLAERLNGWLHGEDL